MKRSLLSFGLGLLALAVASLSSTAAYARPEFSALTVDARTGQVLFSDHPDALRHPASLTKMMTLYVLFQELKSGRVNRNTRFKVSARATHMAPSKLNVRAGTTITVDEAIKALVTKSANDVAVVIAENLSGSESAFARRMTSTAHQIGMSKTTFINASGLPNASQYSTARDMATLGLRLMRDFPQYYPYFRITSFMFHGHMIRTHNQLVQHYPGTDGIKTGYIANAGYNLVTSTRHGEKRLVGVVLGARSARARSIYMRNMLEAHFAEAKEGSTVAALAGSSKGVINPITDKADAEAVAKLNNKGLAKAASEASKTTVLESAIVPVPANDKPTSIEKLAAGDTAKTQDKREEWTIEVGEYSAKPVAQAKLAKIRAKAGDVLDGKSDLMVEVKFAKGGAWLARYSGFDQDEATEACAAIKRLGSTCSVIKPAA